MAPLGAIYAAETEVRSEGLALQKIAAERPEAFLKEPQGPALGTLLGSLDHLDAFRERFKIIEKLGTNSALATRGSVSGSKMGLHKSHCVFIQNRLKTFKKQVLAT